MPAPTVSRLPPAPTPGTEAAPITDVQSAADALAVQASKELFAGHFDEASKMINTALKLRIDRSYYHLLNGLTYHLEAKRGNQEAFDLAEQGYNQAIHFDATNWMAYYFRGRLRLDQGHYGSAMSSLADAITFKPDDIEVLNAFAYAAYRSARPDIAAGALAQIEKSDQPIPRSAWRNYAMAMAALGNYTAAAHYIDRYSDEHAPPAEVAYLRKRLVEWQTAPRSYELIQAQYNGYGVPSQYATGFPNTPLTNSPGFAPGQPGPGGVVPNGAFNTLTAEDRTTAKGSEDKMVVLDVVMISTEENISTTRGVNLMNGLTLQFGTSTLPGYSFVQTLANDGTAGTAITRAISIPSVSYTLNILNANTSRTEVLSRPTLIGLAGKTSEFFSGVELNAAAIAGSAGSGNTILGGQAINIQKEIGIKLGVTPTVLEDGRLKLAVTVERTFLETPSADVNFTFKLETDKDTINANVIMRYGESLILGGLSEKETQYNRDGVPFLQDVPGLQYFFSNEAKSEYQKSMLILLTPRPPTYVYQPESAREAYEQTLSDEERPIANLAARYSDWFRPYPNWASVFHHLQDNGLYREFRTGDVDLESWSSMETLSDRLNQALDFLRY